ncbi:uncharacterized protein LOC130647413 [Hydractinia symbiolongicarpus]|uniref:uncharacterized protein LOC130647413 n=1 Tax=Hydractinia symbiolongicarpus TaxID=13093 RepID=UPI00254F5AB3|nr:uncharacterized protein LOC130647413 [Hydractinia symbiolongicarpus]
MTCEIKMFWSQALALGIGTSMGLTGNAISIVVWKRVLKSSDLNESLTNWLITSAVCNIGLLLSFLLKSAIRSTNLIHKDTPFTAAIFSWCGYPFFSFFVVASVWLSIGVTIKAFLLRISPVNIDARNRTKKVIAMLLLFSLLVNVPSFFVYHSKEKEGMHVLALTTYGESQNSIQYKDWFCYICVIWPPWIALVFIVVFILNLLNRKPITSKCQKGPLSLDSNDRPLCCVDSLLSPTSTPLITLLIWQGIMYGWWIFKGKIEVQKEAHFKLDLTAFITYGVISHSATNWLCYFVTSNLFEKEVRTIFRLK